MADADLYIAWKSSTNKVVLTRRKATGSTRPTLTSDESDTIKDLDVPTKDFQFAFSFLRPNDRIPVGSNIISHILRLLLLHQSIFMHSIFLLHMNQTISIHIIFIIKETKVI